MVVLITIILLYGFGILTYLFFVHYTVVEQINFVVVHLASSLIFFLLWLLDRRYRSVFKENKYLRAMITELEGFKNSAAVLSYTHFLSYVNYIITSTKRRGKKNHLLRINVDSTVENISSLEYMLIDTAVKSFRTNFFDLVTQRVRNEVLVFLQDTTPEGCQTAINRLVAELSKRITLDRLPFNFHIYEIENIGEIEDIGKFENIGEIENTGEVENIVKFENTGEVKNIGKFENIGKIENTENTENVEDVEGIA